MQLAKTLAFVLTLAVSGYQLAANQQTADRGGSSGDTSGPAVGTPVEPPTVVQKSNPHLKPQSKAGESGTAAGSPGIEGKAGAESGQAPNR